MPFEKSCANCRWCFPFEDAKGNTVHQCRVAPPTLHPRSGKTLWPMTKPEFVCGGWMESEQARYERARSDHGDDCICVKCLGLALAHKDTDKWLSLPERVRSDIKRLNPDYASKMEALLKEQA